MSEPSTAQAGSSAAIALRQAALQRLKLPRDSASGDSTAALVVLYQLASSPATAADALALLHELQVHQLELSLQAEQLIESRAELENRLQQLSQQHDAQPAACFSVDAQLRLGDLNLRGTALLGLAREQVLGQSLSAWLEPASIPPLRAAMARIDAGQAQASCRLKLCALNAGSGHWQAGLARDVQPGRYLLNLLRGDELSVEH
ncbi:PAS domain-containing protein [Paucibacter sp. APW11]|uniref:PAS domain-containing protein n=1 Tax=Roseateles aquae TaxID=3077235 RepID=A0ABU3PCC4_9BURK|nr:PAS domain-containing protein [Paucibacter sp. APW11]MDT8999945.1 PAS domain-containing protein [Paucibacter sp. APW11]